MYFPDIPLKVWVIVWEFAMVEQNATARFIGLGSVDFIKPSSPKTCLESALIQPINFGISSIFISCSPLEIIF